MESSNTYNLEIWLTTLTEKEHMIFDKGFTQGLKAVLEDFTDAKIKILNKIADITFDDEDDHDSYRKQLLARMATLDIYEKNYRERIKTLEPSGAALASSE